MKLFGPPFRKYSLKEYNIHYFKHYYSNYSSPSLTASTLTVSSTDGTKNQSTPPNAIHPSCQKSLKRHNIQYSKYNTLHLSFPKFYKALITPAHTAHVTKNISMLLDSQDKPAAESSRERRGVQYSKCNTINLSFPKFQKASIADARIMQPALPKVNHCLPRQNRSWLRRVPPRRLSPVENGGYELVAAVAKISRHVPIFMEVSAGVTRDSSSSDRSSSENAPRLTHRKIFPSTSFPTWMSSQGDQTQRARRAPSERNRLPRERRFGAIVLDTCSHFPAAVLFLPRELKFYSSFKIHGGERRRPPGPLDSFFRPHV